MGSINHASVLLWNVYAPNFDNLEFANNFSDHAPLLLDIDLNSNHVDRPPWRLNLLLSDPSSFLTLIVSMHWTHLLSSINNALTFRVSPPVNGRSRGSNYEYGDKASRLLKHQLKRHAAGHTIPQIKNISGTFFKPWRSFIQYFTDLQTLPWFIFSFYTGLVFIGPISILLNCNC